MGDGPRFTDVYQRTHKIIFAYACRRAPLDLAREATDEAYLVAWRKFDALPSDPVPWLIVTVRNVITELYRRDNRQDAVVDRLIHARMAIGLSDGDGADWAALERLEVLEAVASLSNSDREVLLLTVWDGLTHRQASKVVGCSTAAFAVRHHRARRRFEAALDAVGAEQIDSAHTSINERNRT